MRRGDRSFSRYRLLLVFSCLSIAIAAFSMSVLLSSIRQTQSLRRSQHQYQQNILNSAVENADSLFSISQSLMRQFWHNASSDILPYVVEKDHSVYRILQIMRALSISQDYFSHLGFQISIVDPEDARFISGSLNISLSGALSGMSFDPAIGEEILRLSQPDLMDQTLYFTNKHGNLLICKTWSNSTPGHIFIECYYYDLSALILDIETMEGCAFAIYQNGAPIFSQLHSACPALDEDLFHQALTASQGITAGGFHYQSVNSLFFGFKYLLVSPEFSDSSLWALHDASLGSVLILIPFALLIAYLIAYFLYKPVGRAFKSARNFSDTPLPDAPVINEFDVIEHTLYGMQSKIENLGLIVKNNQPSLREKKLPDVLLGLCPSDDLPALAADAGVPLRANALSILMFEVRDVPNLTVQLLSEISSPIRRALELRLGEFSVPGYDAVLQVMSLRRFCILSAITDLAVLQPLAESITSALENSIGFETISAITLCSRPQSIPDAYDQAFQMLRSSYHRGFHVHTQTESSLPAASPALRYSAEIERELIRSVLDCDTVAANALITRIIAHNTDDVKIPAQQLGYALYTTMLRIIQQSGTDLDIASALEKACRDGSDMNALCQIALESFTALSQAIESGRAASSQDFSQAILHYINENYAQDISLAQIAEHFHFSTVYMSTLFKNVTGTNFKEYLTRVRVAHAKELLAQGHRVYEVSSMVGCNNADTFIRMFKRIAGMSPGRYQQAHSHAEGSSPDTPIFSPPDA